MNDQQAVEALLQQFKEIHEEENKLAELNIEIGSYVGVASIIWKSIRAFVKMPADRQFDDQQWLDIALLYVDNKMEKSQAAAKILAWNE